jgi:uncharacterized protein (TIGR00288 family)
LSEERLKIAVFIDFDNIEIGVRTTLSRRFDVHAVLEAVKERGEVVTKIAYGNWKKSEEYSRALTEHAVQMVQRNLTPGGDKNGADINLALDALEMAFTRDHINAFVIVGGDSDFIALVEKLKQYDKKVFIVGGRAFTSVILQKNCHEFLAYENLIGLQPGTRKSSGRIPAGPRGQLGDAMGPIRRALKILTDREVSPQLGLLKSTLLQLDPTFSERDYGTGSFREFIEKLSAAGFLNLKQVDRSLIVELKDGGLSSSRSEPVLHEAPRAASRKPVFEISGEQPPPAAQGTGNVAALLELFQQARTRPRWPFYLRGLRQYLRSVDPTFDEHKLGFATFHDLVRQAHRDNLLRVERNRQGILRIFAGEHFPAGPQEGPVPQAVLETTASEIPPPLISDLPGEPPLEDLSPEMVAVSAEAEPPRESSPAEEKPKRRRRTTTAAAARRKSTPVRKSRTNRKVQRLELEIPVTE